KLRFLLNNCSLLFIIMLCHAQAFINSLTGKIQIFIYRQPGFNAKIESTADREGAQFSNVS
ncbi:MAG: hypothetical protein ACE5I1_30565, partial [bacterium]